MSAEPSSGAHQIPTRGVHPNANDVRDPSLRTWLMIPWILAVPFYLTTLSAQTDQRIPRQISDPVGAIQGIVRSASGLGLGGTRVNLNATNGGTAVTTYTTGDGVFRILNLPPGSYSLTASRDGFEASSPVSLILRSSEVLGVEIALIALPTPEKSIPAAPDPISIYRDYPITQLPPDGVPFLPPISQNLPPADQVFTPVPDRWQYRYPDYRRYGEPDGKGGDVPFTPSFWYDPFNKNKFKGDEPILPKLLGQQTFLNLTFASDTFTTGHRLPTTSNLGSADPNSEQFFGRFGQFFLSQNFSFGADLFHGDTSYRPFDWRIKFTPEVNVSYLKVRENGIVNADVRQGTTRLAAHAGLQEAFVEAKLRSLSNTFDFVSARAGIQSFSSDFRGFIFSDQEPGLRIFGNLDANRLQYNLAYFAMLEKDTNSGLNTFQYRGRQVYIANVYRQDFLKPGYTIQASVHYDKDDATLHYDDNHFLVRPSAIGIARPHAVRSYYYGLTGDGHFGRINVTHAFYQVLGHDTLNPIAGRATDTNAQMAAAELSMDRDWYRLRVAAFYASGDSHPRDGTARGFDSILDNTTFAGGIFSFWNREGLRLTGSGVGLVQGNSLLADLRSSKLQGQANFVNPGLMLYNAGADFELTPRLRTVLNFSTVQFQHTEPLQLLLFQPGLKRGVGADSGVGVIYRPAVSENIVVTGGFNLFRPFGGFRGIYSTSNLVSGFVNVRTQF
ncbi:MAG: carboxypeptidase-like regulatory domain-containing protein [Acidobacteriota bacterium]